MPVWTNQDGLTIRTGREESVSGIAGSFVDYATGNQVLEINLDLTTLTTTPQIIDEFIRWPKNWVLEQVDTYTEVAPTGGTSINVGFRAPDRTTVISNTAVLSVLPTASMAPQGKKNRISAGDTNAGTTVGQSITQAGAYIVANSGGTFTAGVVKIRLHFHPSRPPVI